MDRDEVAHKLRHADVRATIRALGVVGRMSEEDRKSLLPELLRLCINQRFGVFTRELVLKLPREWLVKNIEAAAEPILTHPEVDNLDYVMLLALYRRVDRTLAMKLAERAIQNSDSDIREAGNDCLSEISADSVGL